MWGGISWGFSHGIDHLRHESMTIVYISKNIPLPGYSENDVILRQTKRFKRDGVHIRNCYPKEYWPSFLTFGNSRLLVQRELSKVFTVDDVDIEVVNYIRMFGSLEWMLARKSSRTQWAQGAELIHAHYVFPDALIALKASEELNVPFVVTVRSGDLINLNKGRINQTLFRSVVKRADSVICLTESLRKALNRFCESSRFEVVPNAIDVDFFSVSPGNSINNDRVQILVVSNLIPRKNVDWVIRQCVKLEGKVELTVVGDGPCYDELEKLSSYCESVRMVGRKSKKDVIEYMDTSDVFVLPSENESFGLVYAEAAARGNVVIGLSGTGLDGAESDSFRFVANEDELKLELLNIIGMPLSCLNRLKLRARDYAERFHPTVVSRALMNIYTGVK